MSTVIKWKDKHGDVLYDANNSQEFTEAVLTIIQTRLDQGYLDHPDDAEDRARKILASGDKDAGWRFLCERKDYEYEYVEQVLTARPTPQRRF